MSFYHQIGAYGVLEMLGSPPDFPGQRVEVIQRPGVDGSSAWLQGSQGDPFQLITKVDTTNIATAQTLLATYQSLRGTTQDIVFRGEAVVNCTYLVLRVRPLDIASLPRGIVGGLDPPSFGWLVAEWTLLPIQTG